MERERTRGRNAADRRPAYVAIGDTLRMKIESQELVPGDRLPSERELVEEFDVARMTVRHALELLQDEGIIERRRGRTGGTFVRGLPPELDLTSPVGIRDQFRAQQVAVSVQESQAAEVTAPPAVALAFGLESGSKVEMREVVYSTKDGGPVACETSYHPLPQARREAGADALTRREDVLNSARPTERERNRLSLAANATLQRITRRAYAGDTLAEFTVLAVRADGARLRAVTAL